MTAHFIAGPRGTAPNPTLYQSAKAYQERFGNDRAAALRGLLAPVSHPRPLDRGVSYLSDKTKRLGAAVRVE